MEPLDYQQRYHGCPNLDAEGILAGPYEGFDLQVLLQRLEEEFYLPSFLIDGRYSARPEIQMIGEKDDILALFCVRQIRGRSHELSVADLEAVNDLPKGVRSCQMTEEH